jgi:hypothetical protein
MPWWGTSSTIWISASLFLLNWFSKEIMEKKTF